MIRHETRHGNLETIAIVISATRGPGEYEIESGITGRRIGLEEIHAIAVAATRARDSTDTVVIEPQELSYQFVK